MCIGAYPRGRRFDPPEGPVALGSSLNSKTGLTS